MIVTEQYDAIIHDEEFLIRGNLLFCQLCRWDLDIHGFKFSEVKDIVADHVNFDCTDAELSEIREARRRLRG